MTKVRATAYAECPFSAAIELAEAAVRQHSDFYLSPSPPLGERVVMKAEATDDRTDTARRHEALLIAWRPQHASLFPEFRGALTVRPRGRGALLLLNGEYEPPFGTPGKLFDGLFGRTIARRTLTTLLLELADQMSVLWSAEQRRPVRHSQFVV